MPAKSHYHYELTPKVRQAATSTLVAQAMNKVRKEQKDQWYNLCPPVNCIILEKVTFK
jgi:hypothetical protein